MTGVNVNMTHLSKRNRATSRSLTEPSCIESWSHLSIRSGPIYIFRCFLAFSAAEPYLLGRPRFGMSAILARADVRAHDQPKVTSVLEQTRAFIFWSNEIILAVCLFAIPVMHGPFQYLER